MAFASPMAMRFVSSCMYSASMGSSAVCLAMVLKYRSRSHQSGRPTLSASMWPNTSVSTMPSRPAQYVLKTQPVMPASSARPTPFELPESMTFAGTDGMPARSWNTPFSSDSDGFGPMATRWVNRSRMFGGRPDAWLTVWEARMSL